MTSTRTASSVAGRGSPGRADFGLIPRTPGALRVRARASPPAGGKGPGRRRTTSTRLSATLPRPGFGYVLTPAVLSAHLRVERAG